MFDMCTEVARQTFRVPPRTLPRDYSSNHYFYGQPESEMQYNEIVSEEKLTFLMTEVMEDYNKKNAQNQISVVIFNSIIEKTLKINRSV